MTETKTGGMACPICGVGLVMTDRQGIEIDFCPTCRGVWLDRGELDKIIERSLGDAGAQRNYGNESGGRDRHGSEGHGYGGHGRSGGHGSSHGSGHGGSHGGSHGERRHGSFLGRLFD